jgi:TetR/AcrR family transcriptional regulator, lmrAB and yxaGH operons repressor
MLDEPSTRDRLITAAAALFRRKGYHATGLAEILAEAGVPKGSLYHHFPDGKADLARSAADWTADMLVRIIDDAFQTAPGYEEGVAHYCAKLAKLFQIADASNTCPISALLFDGPESDAFRLHAERVFQRLIDAVARHGQKFGLSAADANRHAETLLIAVEGAWTLARARRDGTILRSLPQRLPAA